MIVDCKACGIEHGTMQEATEMHAATASIHAWLHAKMEFTMREPPPPPVRKVTPPTKKKPVIWKIGETA